MKEVQHLKNNQDKQNQAMQALKSNNKGLFILERTHKMIYYLIANNSKKLSNLKKKLSY